MSRRKHWSESFGRYGCTVRVFEEKGRLFARIRGDRIKDVSWDDTDEGRARAKAWAKDQAELLKAGQANAGDPVPTCARVFALYLDRESPRHGEHEQYEDRRASKLFTRFLGAARDLSKLTVDEWVRFIDARRAGAIDAVGENVPAPAKPKDEQRRPVGPRTVEADLEWLRRVIRWACVWKDPETDLYLMSEDPTRGREFTEKIPHEANPRRPVATDDRYERVLAKALDVHRFLPVILTLAHGTGRRIRAILALRHEDLSLQKGEQWPHGRIRWRAEEDKLGKEWVAPINADVRAALRDFVPHIGATGPLFPNAQGQPISYELASKWLQKAERLAKVEKQRGSLWHAYRRGWATARKGLPVQDVAYAGGWTNVATLETIYQQPDPESTYRVVAEPVKLRDVQHG